MIVVVRSDGLPAVDVASARATAWFVHQPTGRVVLVDGYGGRALASLDAGTQDEQLSVAEGGPGAFILNDTTAEARAIDSVELRLGTPFGLTALGAGRALSGVGQAGLVVVNPDDDEASVVPAEGEPISFAVEAGTATHIAPDGSVWSLVDGDLVRTTSAGPQRTRLGIDSDALLSLVGNMPLVVDVSGRRARLGDGAWRSLDTDADPSEILAQVPGPPNGCGWVGANDDLWCVSAGGIDDTASVPGLDIDGGDFLAIAGEAAAVVRRGPNSVVQFDWRNGEILDDSADVSADATLAVTATVDLSGRPYLVYDLTPAAGMLGTWDTELITEFFGALTDHGRFCLHLHQLHGRNSHHIVEAGFKAFARALRQAIKVTGSGVPSTKGSLE